jgi:hypothetical protein
VSFWAIIEFHRRGRQQNEHCWSTYCDANTDLAQTLEYAKFLFADDTDKDYVGVFLKTEKNPRINILTLERP